MTKNSYTCAKCGVFGWVGVDVITHADTCPLFVPSAEVILAEVPETPEGTPEAPEAPAEDATSEEGVTTTEEATEAAPEGADTDPETPAPTGAYTQAYLKALVKKEQVEILRTLGIDTIDGKAVRDTKEQDRIDAILANQVTI